MLNSHGVAYLIQGKKHWSVLCASLLSLRDYWKGPVCIFSADEAGEEIAEMLLLDGRMNITHRPLEGALSGRRHAGYANKPRLMLQSPYASTVFLDADTIVVGDIGAMFPPEGKVQVTEFCGWSTVGNKMRGRIEKWRQCAPEMVEACFSQKGWRAINTGVFGFDYNCDDFAETWLELTYRNISFMCDEIACQLMLTEWHDMMQVMPDDFNKSPLHGNNFAMTRIYHFHGRKHVKTERTREIWLPIYRRCLAMNLANIQKWSPGSDRRLAEHLQQFPESC